MSKKSKIREIQEKLNELTSTLATLEDANEPMVKMGDIVVGGAKTQSKRLVCKDASGDLFLVTLEGKHKGELTNDLVATPDEDGEVALSDLLNNYDSTKWSKLS